MALLSHRYGSVFEKDRCGYAMGDRINAELACKAFKIALMRRPQAKELTYHSDRGSVYGSLKFRELLIDNGITPSMSRRGNCYDNAVAESFFHTIKVELIFRNEYRFKVAAILSVSKWIENFYNTERTHSTFGNGSPVEFEALNSLGLSEGALSIKRDRPSFNVKESNLNGTPYSFLLLLIAVT